MRCAFLLLPYNLRLCYALFPSHSTKYVLIRFMKNIIFIISPVGSLITCKKNFFPKVQAAPLRSTKFCSQSLHSNYVFILILYFGRFLHSLAFSVSLSINPNIAPKPTEENNNTNNHNNRRRLLALFFQTINSFNRFRTVSIEWMYVVILKVHYCRILLTQSACLNDNIQMQRRKMYGIMIWEF